MPAAKNLKALRTKKMRSQQELADQAKVAKGTIVRLEAGRDANYGTIRKLAEALGVEPEELVGG